MAKLRDQLVSIGLRALLWARSQTRGISRALDGMALPQAGAPSRDDIVVAAIQLSSDPVPSAAAYARKLASLVAQAVAQGAHLVVFPEYAALPLLGLIPGVAGSSAGEALAESDTSIADVLAVALPAADRIWRYTHSQLALRCRVALMPGTIPQPAPERSPRPYRNTAFLFGPDGALLGTQDKLHLTAREVDWVCPGNELRVFDLGWGLVAVPVCMDYTYWETVRVAGLHGAEIMLSPVAEPTANDPWRQARGVRNRIQETPAYGVQSCLVGDLFGETATGATAIYAPLGLISAEEDTLAAAHTTDQEEVVVAPLDLAALRAFRQRFPSDFNPELYRRYLPALYGSLSP